MIVSQKFNYDQQTDDEYTTLSRVEKKDGKYRIVLYDKDSKEVSMIKTEVDAKNLKHPNDYDKKEHEQLLEELVSTLDL